VNRINEMVKNKEKNIKLVFVTGDLTDGALHFRSNTQTLFAATRS
jgi:3-deoxy-D-manno-octulosonate 8-phosphate phosphatase KdsC-like HAD superfamily phosphatase